jgi:uncharacterized protein (TIGR02246 family)
MKTLILYAFLCMAPFRMQAQSNADREIILSILDKQENDWNHGDIKAFMMGYWPSDSLTFVGSKGVTYGYENIYENYLKRYPDRASMGKLKFTIKEVNFPAKEVAYVIGKFHLTRPEKGDAEGHFTILWRKINGKWLIVSDHSS